MVFEDELGGLRYQRLLERPYEAASGGAPTTGGPRRKAGAFHHGVAAARLSQKRASQPST